jgi:hypothetical protein
LKAGFSSLDFFLGSSSRNVFGSGRSELSGKRKRAFHRLVSGFTRAHYRGDRLRFMTLTSASSSEYGRLSRDFQVLRKRIFHAFGFCLSIGNSIRMRVMGFCMLFSRAVLFLSVGFLMLGRLFMGLGLLI